MSRAKKAAARILEGRSDANLDFAAFRKLVPADGAILDSLIAAANKAVAEKKK